MPTPAEITGITSRRGSKRRLLSLDGAEWRAVPSPVVAALGLREGDTVVPDELDAAVREAEPTAARERAIRLIAYRDRSVSEMRSRLLDDGYSAGAVADVVDWLLDTGLVDDRRFAEQRARSLAHIRKYGRERTLRELRAGGVADELAIEVLEEVSPAQDEAERAAVLARSLLRAGDTVDRMAARLVRKGFSAYIALDTARRIVSRESSSSDAPDEL